MAVPRSPRIRTPPILGLIALRVNAVFMVSWPTMAVKGKTALDPLSDNLDTISPK